MAAIGRFIGSAALLSGYLGRSATQLSLLWLFSQQGGGSGAAAAAGEFNLAFALATPIVIASELGMRNVLQTIDRPPPFRVFLAARLSLGSTAFALLCALSLTGLVSSDPGVLVPIALLKLADSLLDIAYAALQSNLRVRRVAGVLWLNNGLSLVAIMVVYAVEADPQVAVLASAVMSFGSFLLCAPGLLISSEVRWVPNQDEAWRLLRAGGALGFAQTTLSLFAYLPSFYLAQGASTSVLGVYAVCQYAVSVWGLMAGASMQTWLAPLRTVLTVEGEREFRRRYRLTLRAFFTMGLLGAAAVQLLLGPTAAAVFGEEFEVSAIESVPFALTIVAISLDTAAALLLQVRNKYAARTVTTVAGFAVSGLLFVLSRDSATLAVAGCLTLAGVATRATLSLAIAAWARGGPVGAT